MGSLAGSRLSARHRLSAVSLGAVLIVVAAACASSSPSPTAPIASVGPSASADARVAGWSSDLDLLIPGLEEVHPDPYHSTSKTELEAAIADLEASIPDANDDELMVGLLRVVAMVSAAGRDGHTGAFIWGDDSSYPVHSLPLRIWLFPEGPIIVDALPPYEDLIGTRIETVGGQPVSDVISAIEPLVPRDNDETVKLVTPRLLLIPEVLHGLGITGQAGAVELGWTTAGDAQTASVEPVAMSDYNAWAGPYGLHLPDDPKVLYLSRTQEELWWQTLPGGRDLYVQYNRVEHVDTSTMEELGDAARRADRVIVDIRHNFGGDSFGYLPMLELLTSDDVRSKPLFVITSRNTFSAASLFAAEVERETDATFVGEPMGGSPNLYGNPGTISMPYSGIVVSVAGEYFVGSELSDPRLTIPPDLPTQLGPVEYFGHRDPSLAAIEATRGH